MIAEQIASESNLKLMYIADNIPKYKRKSRCRRRTLYFTEIMQGGRTCTETTLNVVIYDAAEYDSKPPIKP